MRPLRASLEPVVRVRADLALQDHDADVIDDDTEVLDGILEQDDTDRDVVDPDAPERDDEEAATVLDRVLVRTGVDALQPGLVSAALLMVGGALFCRRRRDSQPPS